MKKLFTLALFILTNIALAQDKLIDYNIPSDSLEIHTVLEPYVEEFVQEAKERGFYVRFLLMEKMDYIKVHPGLGTTVGDDRLGVVGIDYRGFYVTPRILDNPIKLRLTIFHEIGHVLKGTPDHTCDTCYDIMSAYSHPDLHVYTVPAFWEEKLDDYFKWLNTK